MSERSAVSRILQATSILLSTSVLIGAFVIVALWPAIVRTTQVGHASVVWRLISWTGSAKSIGPVSEGVTVILPWDKFYTYDIRLQTLERSYDVVSADGLHFSIDLSIRWNVIRENIVSLNQRLGPNYVNTLLIPEIGSVLREVIVQYDAVDLYTTNRTEIQSRIFAEVVRDSLGTGIAGFNEEVQESVVSLQDILIMNIELPASIKKSIESKLSEGQLVEEFKLRIEREKLESERKRVEAKGIKDFQATITPGISDSYLRWRGIEATLELAQSENSKIVVIGNDASGGLPLIMDTRSDSNLSVTDPAPVEAPADAAPAPEATDVPPASSPTPPESADIAPEGNPLGSGTAQPSSN